MPRVGTPGTHQTAGCVGLRTSPDSGEVKYLLTLPSIELHVIQPVA